MKHFSSIAAIFIASCALSTGASGEEVYRCGNAYSQKPCTDAVLVDVQDARTREQKAQADAATQREAAAANAMEKARLKEEAQQRAANAKLAAADKKKQAAKPKKAASAADTADAGASSGKTKKASAKKKKKKEPEFFTARAAVDKPTPAPSASK